MPSFKLTLAILLPLFFIEDHSEAQKVLEVELERFEQVDGLDLAKANIRVRKYNRTIHVLSGTVQLLEDLDNGYEVGITFANSPLGNNQFNEFPFKLTKEPFCRFLNDSYSEYQHLLKDGTTLPQVPPEGLCPYPKGAYHFNDWVLNSSAISKYAPDGYWRMTWTLEGPKNATFVFFARISHQIQKVF